MGAGASEDCGKIRIGDLSHRSGITDGGESLSPRIAGGHTVPHGYHPWQASIRIRGRDQTYHWCGATIINRFYVITAAHCLRDFPMDTYFVRYVILKLPPLNICCFYFMYFRV